ncbi:MULTISPECIES: hypothetical protein [Rhizobium/Agrobacterium group]|uniref:Uncharacterized protein n=1 Tax=Rhizobium rhizogenes TaxID=359 RepID=A0AA92C5S6_RHIRH|nr:hypothetical protein [Rhizobium rhizogenes]PVE56503.1 hypothetical protein DC430_01550 [Rhizobium rhizogenes]PVE64999.1 hypothetical protein DC415_14755 [Agrobacterium tumefaciens]PVE74137.1 hypothetical protein DCP16_14755 [Sphingomonas sp. TPD3009]
MWTLKNRFVTAGLVALTIAGTTIATTSQAEARNNFGRGLAAGIAGTLVGGALLSAAHDRPVYGTPVYAAPTYYGPPPVVYEPVYPRCHVAWRQDGFGDMYRVRVCD